MPGLVAQLPDPAQLQAIRDGVTEQSQTLDTIKSTLGSLPLADIQALAGTLNGLSLPDLTPLAATLPSNLGDLAGRLPADPAALLGQLPQVLGQLAGGAQGDLLAQLGPALEQFPVFQELSGKLAAIQEAVSRLNPLLQALSDPHGLATKSPAELLQFVSDLLPLAQPFGLVGGSTQTWVLGLLETLKLLSSGTPSQLSEFVSARIATLASQVQAAGAGIPATLAGLEGLIGSLPGSAPASLLAPALVDLQSLSTLDFAQAGGLETARTTLGRIQTALGGVGATLAGQVGAAGDRLRQSGAGALEDELQGLVFVLRSVADLDALDNPLMGAARQLSDWIALLDSPATQVVVQAMVGELRDLAKRFDLSALQAPLLRAAGTILDGVGEVERLQSQIAAGITGLFEELNQAIEQIDLAAVQQRIEETLQAFQQQVGPVQAQVQGLAAKLHQFLTDLEDLPELSLQTIVDQLSGLLAQVDDALTDPGVAGALDTVRQSLEGMAEALDGLSFDPVIEQVTADIEATTAQLREIDPQSLNELLRAALKAAVAVLQSTDFQHDVTDALVGELDDLEQGALAGAQQAARGFDALTAGVRQLDPEALIAGPLNRALDEVQHQVASVRPSRALQPALAELNTLVDRLADLSPSRLLQPVVDFRGHLVDLVGNLSAATLLQPLEEALKALREALAPLNPDTWFAPLEQYSASVGSVLKGLPVLEVLPRVAALDLQAVQLFTGLDPEHVAVTLRASLGKALGVPDAVDVAPARSATVALHDALDGASPSGIRDRVQATLDTIQHAAALDLATPLTSLSRAWSDARAAAAAVTPPDALRDAHAEVTQLLEATNPTTLLAPAAGAVDGLRVALTALGTGTLGAVDRATVTVDALVARLRALYPRDLSLGFLQQSLLDALGDVLIAPAVAIARALQTHSSAVAGLLNAIHEIITALTRAVGFIVDPVSLLRPIRDALHTLYERVTSFGLGGLAGQIDGTAGVVREQLAAFDLGPLLAQLDAIFADFVQGIRGLLSQTLVTELDGAFDDRVNRVVQQLDVDTLLAPLQPTLQEIRDALALLSVETLFAPLAEALKRLLDELKEGLRQTGTAFGQMVQAIPV